jgi:thiol-disulfide isomerase/thioredoxin
MNLLLPRTIKFFMVFIAILMLTNACSSGGSHSGESVYVSSENPMLDVQTGLEKAKANEKLLLVVMGAQWCHDSRGLAEKFYDNELAGLLSDNYEVVFVDVGYYKDLRDISQRFSQAHYYATPTVMIINAQTERLINAKDMHIWGSADSIPLSKYVDYFEAYANNSSAVFVPLPQSHESAIIAFEQQNAQRLSDAYTILVPAMKIERKTGEANDLFIKQWREVRKYRTSLQKDIQSIRQQAIESPSQAIVFPSYAPFSWETEV